MTPTSSKAVKDMAKKSGDPLTLLSSLSNADFMQAFTRRIIESALGIKIVDDPNDSMAVSRQIVEGLQAAQAARDNKLELPTEMSSMIHKLILETLLNAEMDQHLGYKRYEHKNKGEEAEKTPSKALCELSAPSSGEEATVRAVEPENTLQEALQDDSGTKPTKGRKNCRNGSYSRTVRTKSGDISVAVPRDRSGGFHSMFMPKGKVVELSNCSEHILQLAAMGNSVRDIARIFKEMFDVDVSHEYVQLVLEHFQPRLKAWQERELKPFYPFVFIDCTYVPIRNPQGRVTQTPVYVILGIDMDGKKELLGLEILGESEGSHGWMNIFGKLQSRGLKDVLFVCMDGVSGVEEGLKSIFPNVITQRCIVHLIRNSCQYVASKDRKAWCADLKRIYSAPDYETGLAALVQLSEKWTEKVPAGVAFWERHFDKDIAPLYDFPPAIRKIIYTTNAIESVNSSLKSVVKKGCYNSNEGALTAMLLRADKVLATNWDRRPVQHWNQILNQLTLHERTRASSPSTGNSTSHHPGQKKLPQKT